MLSYDPAAEAKATWAPKGRAGTEELVPAGLLGIKGDVLNRGKYYSAS